MRSTGSLHLDVHVLCRIRTERNGGAWCPKQQISSDVYEWLEVDLGQLTVVTQVETQGRFGNGQVSVRQILPDFILSSLVHFMFFISRRRKTCMSSIIIFCDAVWLFILFSSVVDTEGGRGLGGMAPYKLMSGRRTVYKIVRGRQNTLCADRSTVKYAFQNTQNDRYQRLSDSSRVHQIHFRPGLRPGPHWGSLQRSPDPLPKFKGSYF